MAGFEDIIAGLGNKLAQFTAGHSLSSAGFAITPTASPGFAPGGSTSGGFAPGASPQAGQWHIGGDQMPGFAVGPPGGGGGFNVGGGATGGFAVGSVSGGFHPGAVPTPAPVSSDGGGASGGPSAGLKPEVAAWSTQAQQTFGQYADVMLAIMTNESRGDPNAYNAAGPAYGLFQQLNMPGLSADQQFASAKKLLDEKLAGIAKAYTANGLNPDDRTRARDIALAWGGHFDYDTGRPNPDSRDRGSGQTASELAAIFLANYDAIKNGRSGQGGVPTGGGSGDLAQINAPWARVAQQYLGVPYTNGGIRQTGDPRSGMDCSSFTGYALGLPTSQWNAQAQYDNTQRVTAQQAQAGDLIFFQGTTTGDPSARPVTHVGIYIGNGKMVHTGGDGGVMVVDLNSQYWQSKLYGFGRVRR